MLNNLIRFRRSQHCHRIAKPQFQRYGAKFPCGMATRDAFGREFGVRSRISLDTAEHVVAPTCNMQRQRGNIFQGGKSIMPRALYFHVLKFLSRNSPFVDLGKPWKLTTVSAGFALYTCDTE